MWLFEKLLWDLPEVVDEPDSRILLQRIINANGAEKGSWLRLRS
jgi:hypothetical protein